MGRGKAGHLIGAALAGVLLIGATPVRAQEKAPASSAVQQIVTLDWERLFEDSAWGKRVKSDLAEAGAALNAENDRIAEQLIAEEGDLTEKRASMPAEDFRAAAEAFDKRATTIRTEQRAKAQALSRRLEDERQAFTVQVLPLLDEYLEAHGAAIVVDTRAVIRALARLDVTEDLIAMADERLGAGQAPLPSQDDPTGGSTAQTSE